MYKTLASQKEPDHAWECGIVTMSGRVPVICSYSFEITKAIHCGQDHSEDKYRGNVSRFNDQNTPLHE